MPPRELLSFSVQQHRGDGSSLAVGGTGPITLDYLSQGKFDLVINIPKNYQEEELTNDYIIRRRAADFGVPLITNIQLAERFVEALARKRLSDLEIKSWSEYEDRVTDIDLSQMKPVFSYKETA